MPAIAVDAACSKNPGPVEYQCVDLRTGRRIFHVGPLQEGTNNIGEFLAIVHAMALLVSKSRTDIAIYSDSRTGMSWVNKGKANTKIAPTEANAYIRSLVVRAEAWLASHPAAMRPRLYKWDTDNWGRYRPISAANNRSELQKQLRPIHQQQDQIEYKAIAEGEPCGIPCLAYVVLEPVAHRGHY